MMKVEFNLLKFEKRGDDAWNVLNRAAGYVVGQCVYYPPWESWVFKPSIVQRYSCDVLGDIQKFMEQLK